MGFDVARWQPRVREGGAEALRVRARAIRTSRQHGHECGRRADPAALSIVERSGVRVGFIGVRPRTALLPAAEFARQYRALDLSEAVTATCPICARRGEAIVGWPPRRFQQGRPAGRSSTRRGDGDEGTWSSRSTHSALDLRVDGKPWRGSVLAWPSTRVRLISTARAARGRRRGRGGATGTRGTADPEIAALVPERPAGWRRGERGSPGGAPPRHDRVDAGGGPPSALRGRRPAVLNPGTRAPISLPADHIADAFGARVRASGLAN